MKKYLKDIIIAIGVIGFSSFVFFSIRYNEIHFFDSICEVYENHYKMELNSIVLKKYVDYRNHGHTYIYLKNNMVDSLVLFNIDTYVFESIKVGDSLTKKSNSDSIHVYDPLYQVRKSFIIVYGCPKARRDSIAFRSITIISEDRHH